jgi:hypothetical protein
MNNNNDDPSDKVHQRTFARSRDKLPPPLSRLRAIPSNILPDMNATIPLMIPPQGGFLRRVSELLLVRLETHLGIVPGNIDLMRR